MSIVLGATVEVVEPPVITPVELADPHAPTTVAPLAVGPSAKDAVVEVVDAPAIGHVAMSDPTSQVPVLPIAGPRGPAGSGEGLPAGGAAGDVLAKKTSGDYDVEWTAAVEVVELPIDPVLIFENALI